MFYDIIMHIIMYKVKNETLVSVVMDCILLEGLYWARKNIKGPKT